jgi:formate dehydrogenase subunit gamma
MTTVSERTTASPAAGELERYSFAERLLHWWVAITFIALMVSGFALGYPRMAFLAGLFGGGQSMRFLHPWLGVGFTAGVVVMFFAWLREMKFDQADRQWTKKLRTYAGSGHSGLDTGRYNAGQKGYFWFSVVLGLVLFLTGVFLWFPWLAGAGINRASRLLHHAVFLLTVGGFILHVYLSAIMFPGTLSAMTTGRVTRAWAAWHHPRWFREQEASTRR